MSRFLHSLGVVCLFTTAVVAQPLPLWQDLEPGPYHAGFEVRFLWDESRPFPSNSDKLPGRPIRIMVWYPTLEEDPDRQMRFVDYIDVESPETQFGPVNELLRQRDRGTAFRQFQGPKSDSLAGVLLRTQTQAYHEAPPAAGRFPLIIHSLGLNDFQQESTVLWEYLASHGYVVANVPQLGSDVPEHRLRFDRPSQQIQRRDILFAFNSLREDDIVDSTRTGLMGHSAGGMVALMTASLEPTIRAVVMLDGSAGTREGRALMQEMGFVLEDVTAPVLTLYPDPKPTLDLGGIEAMIHADRYLISFRNATHFDFQNWPLYSVLTRNADPRGIPYRSVETGRDVYLSAVRMTLLFLDLVLNNITSNDAFLLGEHPAPGVVDSLLSFRFLPGSNR